MPMVVEAPGWLMMTIGWPRPASAALASTRAVWSVLPPAVHGTIMVIGFSGYSAWATLEPNATAAASAATTLKPCNIFTSALRCVASMRKNACGFQRRDGLADLRRQDLQIALQSGGCRGVLQAAGRQ